MTPVPLSEGFICFCLILMYMQGLLTGHMWSAYLTKVIGRPIDPPG
jgi:hypothetical protein